MKTNHLTMHLALTVLGAALVCTPALAASGSTPGETSGPAAGGTTVPNAAVEKHASSGNASTAAGGVGVEGKGGGESGHAQPGKAQPQNR